MLKNGTNSGCVSVSLINFSHSAYEQQIFRPLVRSINQEMQMDDYEKYATGLMIVFGALIIGGLMAVNIVAHDKPGFLFALGAAVVAWFSAFAVIFDKPRLYGVMIAAAIALVGASITAYVT